ncbi:hypothetical protein F8388_003264 [Cannabis sativa]|uniref:Uncharacterized protein n=1 Tax=Cannabis sativa TaxID=3483 RepID=A0A7J6DZW3_CANSA|nr:hypothetical protein F8388_003264 [Cannabis sativa]KAF4370941.1 hypothetical protein G4B88_012741 [Cannabis sativa]
MDDLHDTATAYYDLLKHETKLAIKAFCEEMETKVPDKISFEEFSKYMNIVGFSQFGSKKFFDQLRRRGRDHLIFADIITLLYIIESGRPFCQGTNCENNFIPGMYFTCVKCFFENNCDYFFNVCPKCFYNGHYKHCHKEFLDPIVMLRLKTKQDQSSSNNDVTYQKVK